MCTQTKGPRKEKDIQYLAICKRELMCIGITSVMNGTDMINAYINLHRYDIIEA